MVARLTRPLQCLSALTTATVCRARKARVAEDTREAESVSLHDAGVLVAKEMAGETPLRKTLC